MLFMPLLPTTCMKHRLSAVFWIGAQSIMNTNRIWIILDCEFSIQISYAWTHWAVANYQNERWKQPNYQLTTGFKTRKFIFYYHFLSLFVDSSLSFCCVFVFGLFVFLLRFLKFHFRSPISVRISMFFFFAVFNFFHRKKTHMFVIYFEYELNKIRKRGKKTTIHGRKAFRTNDDKIPNISHFNIISNLKHSTYSICICFALVYLYQFEHVKGIFFLPSAFDSRFLLE